MKTNLIIRADGNTSIGSGHLMRCIALAQGWKAEGGSVTFITTCDSEALLRRLYSEEFHVFQLQKSYPNPDDWGVTSKILSDIPEGWVVLDGYHFDSGYHRQIQQSRHRLLVVDDINHLQSYHTNILLNPNINAENLPYSYEPLARLLLGTRYVQLRSEFMNWRGWQRDIPRLARKVLLTFGGGDEDNQTLKSIRAMQKAKIDGLEVTVVVGPHNPHLEVLRAATLDSKLPIRLVSNAVNMPELMAWADLAISAGGSTCWELSFMGLPVLVITLTENQQAVAEGLENEGIAVNMGWYDNVKPTHIARRLSYLAESADVRAEMSKRGREIVDGKGNERVIKNLLTYAQT